MIIYKLFYLLYSGNIIKKKIFKNYLFFFCSGTNDTNDYLRLLNSTWNDHILRSVSTLRKKDAVLNHFVSKIETLRKIS